jgi:O-antigen ligase
MWRHRVLLHRPIAPIFFEFLDITLYTNDLLWWGAVGAWLLSRLFRQDREPLQLGPWFVSVPLTALLVLSAVGIPFAVDPLYAGYQTTRLLLLVLLYLAVVNLPIRAGVVGWAFAAGIALQAAFALPQFALGRTLGFERLGEVTVQAAWPGASVVMAGEQRWLRAYGLAQHPNLLGGCLMVMLLVVLGHYLKETGNRRWPLLAALGLGLLSLLLTFSRAAWLGTISGGMGGLVMLLLVRRRRDWLPSRSSLIPLATVVLIIAAVFLVLYWPLLQPRLGLTSQGVEIRSVESRALQTGAATTLIRMRPLLGVGMGNYPFALYTLAPETVAAYPVYQPVYNVTLLTAAELGLLGGLFWLMLMVSPWIALWRRRRQMAVGPWWAGLSGALLGLAVVSVFDHYFWASHQGRLLLWLVLGLWAREWLQSTAEEKSQ